MRGRVLAGARSADAGPRASQGAYDPSLARLASENERRSPARFTAPGRARPRDACAHSAPTRGRRARSASLAERGDRSSK